MSLMKDWRASYFGTCLSCNTKIRPFKCWLSTILHLLRGSRATLVIHYFVFIMVLFSFQIASLFTLCKTLKLLLIYCRWRLGNINRLLWQVTFRNPWSFAEGIWIAAVSVCYIQLVTDSSLNCASKTVKWWRSIILFREMLESEEQKHVANPANFGPDCLRQCMCEVPGQVPCPAVVPLPAEKTGKGRKAILLKLKEEEEKAELAQRTQQQKHWLIDWLITSMCFCVFLCFVRANSYWYCCYK